jgi:all-trans-retinol 13,14-reductase
LADSYDAVIIGAGLGGLAAAVTLASAGRKVRLLEQHWQVGGYATTFTRGPFEFEASLHELSGIGQDGRRGGLWRALEELGVGDAVSFAPVREFFRTVGPGLDLRLPFGRAQATAALCEAFPEEARGIQRVHDHFYAIRSEIDRMNSRGGKPSMLSVVARYPRLAHAATVPLASILYREIHAPRARCALGQIWSYFGLPPEQLSLLTFMAGYTTYLNYGASYPEGKSQALSTALLRRFQQLGGELSLSNGAAEILTDSDGVCGVMSEQGERLGARRVIANANPIHVAVDLLGRERLPAAFLARLAATRPSLGTVCVYLGLRQTVDELGIHDHEVFFNSTLDLEAQHRACLRLEPPENFLLTAYNVAEPQASPRGTAVVTLCALSDGRLWTQMPPEEYLQIKEAIAEQMVARAAAFYPGLRAAIDTCVVSTPITNLRYTRNAAGAIYGFEARPEESAAFRFSSRGPIPGLWFAGAWTGEGGGYQPCIDSGRKVARQVLEEQAARSKGQSRS